MDDTTEYNGFENLPNEIWRDVRYYQGRVQISNAGRMRYISKRGKVLETPQLCPINEYNGRKSYIIYNPKKKKQEYYKGEYVRDDHFSPEEFIKLAEEIKDTTNSDL